MINFYGVISTDSRAVSLPEEQSTSLPIEHDDNSLCSNVPNVNSTLTQEGEQESFPTNLANTSPPNTTQTPPHKEVPQRRTSYFQLPPIHEGTGSYQSGGEDRKSDYIVYDIECLVKEISDLEKDEASNRSNKSRTNSGTPLKAEGVSFYFNFFHVKTIKFDNGSVEYINCGSYCSLKKKSRF